MLIKSQVLFIQSTCAKFGLQSVYKVYLILCKIILPGLLNQFIQIKICSSKSSYLGCFLPIYNGSSLTI